MSHRFIHRTNINSPNASRIVSVVMQQTKEQCTVLANFTRLYILWNRSEINALSDKMQELLQLEGASKSFNHIAAVSQQLSRFAQLTKPQFSLVHKWVLGINSGWYVIGINARVKTSISMTINIGFHDFGSSDFFSSSIACLNSHSRTVSRCCNSIITISAGSILDTSKYHNTLRNI